MLAGPALAAAALGSDDSASPPAAAAPALGPLGTTVRNVSGSERHYPFLGASGVRLAAGATFEYPGGPIGGLAPAAPRCDRERATADFLRAIRAGWLEIVDGPPPIMTDGVTRETKVLALSSGVLGTADPSYGPNVDL